MRKIVSVLLALCVMVGMLPVSAAEYTYEEPKEPEAVQEAPVAEPAPVEEEPKTEGNTSYIRKDVVLSAS